MSDESNQKDQENWGGKDQEDNDSASLRYLSLAFISLIFVIIILAVGTQLVFSPEKVTSWVKSSLDETGLRDKLKESKIKIEFKKAQTTLTGSLFYPIGVRLNDVKVSADRGCKQFQTSFNSVVVPFGIVEILKGDFKLGTIKFNDGLTEENDMCVPQTNSAVKSASKKPFEKRLLEFDKIFKDLFLSLQNEDTSFNKVQGLLVYDWSFTEESDSTSIKLSIDRLKVYNLTGDFILKGEWLGSIAFKKESLDFDGEVVVSDEHISFSSELKYKEGKAFLNHFYERGKNSILQASVDNMPMSVLIPLFSFEKKFSAGFLRSTWLSSKLRFDLSSSEIKSSLDSFDLKTEEGAMDLVSGKASGQWTSSQKKWSLEKPVKFIFTNFKALNLLNLSVQEDLSKVLSNFGKFDLSLTVDESLNVKGAFESTGQSLSIRSGGRLGVQNILSSLGDFNWSPEKDFKVRLYQLRLEKGEFEGEFIYTLSDNKTKLIADVKELSLNPELWQEVFKVEDVGSFAIKGEAEVERKTDSGNRDVVSKFSVDLDVLNHKYWTLEKARFDCAFSEFLSCNLKFSDIYPKSKLKDWFSEEGRSGLIEDLRKRGEVTLQDKALELSLFYKKSYGGKLTLNWSIDQGPVLYFPNDSELNLRAL